MELFFFTVFSVVFSSFSEITLRLYWYIIFVFRLSSLLINFSFFHPTGTLRLKSHVELHLEKGAVLLGGTKRDDYDGIDFDAGRRPRHATRRAKAVRPIQGRVVGDAESVTVEVRSRVRQA